MEENRKSVEARISKLEKQVGILLARAGIEQPNWIADISGICRVDSDFDQIVGFGKELRDAEQPEEVMIPDSVKQDAKSGIVEMANGITVDPNVSHGRPCVMGTRVPVTVVLDNLAAGVSTDDILKSYPSLTVEGISACLRYASQIVKADSAN